MSERELEIALDELLGAIRDAIRRYQAGDGRALESNMLQATITQADIALRDARHAA